MSCRIIKQVSSSCIAPPLTADCGRGLMQLSQHHRFHKIICTLSTYTTQSVSTAGVVTPRQYRSAVPTDGRWLNYESNSKSCVSHGKCQHDCVRDSRKKKIENKYADKELLLVPLCFHWPGGTSLLMTYMRGKMDRKLSARKMTRIDFSWTENKHDDRRRRSSYNIN